MATSLNRLSDFNAVIKLTDMTEDMQREVIATAENVLENYNNGKDIARHIKMHFIDRYPGFWHCVVGRNFGAFVTHEAKHYIYFYIGQMAFLLYKSG